jgi:predicted amidophosphoribosyltransferase
VACRCPRRPRYAAAVCNAPVFDAVRATFIYAEPLDRLLRFKFHRDLAAGALLSLLMVQALREDPPADWPQARCCRCPCIVAACASGVTTRRWSWPGRWPGLSAFLRGHLLQRVQATRAQSWLDAAARRRNLRQAFEVRGEVPAHVVLVDDVMTTGATVEAAARALRKAGARRVDVWVCARVP